MINDDDPDEQGCDTGPVVTPGGRTLYESDFEALADEAERGYDVSHLAQRRVSREREHEMRRAIMRAVQADRDRTEVLAEEMALVRLFHKARHRQFLDWCALRFWHVSETGLFGTLGNWCDSIEVASRRARARRNLARKQ